MGQDLVSRVGIGLEVRLLQREKKPPLTRLRILQAGAQIDGGRAQVARSHDLVEMVLRPFNEPDCRGNDGKQGQQARQHQ
jgi:hypothetical protein